MLCKKKTEMYKIEKSHSLNNKSNKHLNLLIIFNIVKALKSVDTINFTLMLCLNLID